MSVAIKFRNGGWLRSGFRNALNTFLPANPCLFVTDYTSRRKYLLLGREVRQMAGYNPSIADRLRALRLMEDRNVLNHELTLRAEGHSPVSSYL